MDPATGVATHPNKRMGGGSAVQGDPIHGRPSIPWWHALLIDQNRETKAELWLRRVNVEIYLPAYSRVVTHRHHASVRRNYPALPGLLFASVAVIDIPRRTEIFAFAHVQGFLKTSNGSPAMIPDSEIEKVRTMEARLNLPPQSRMQVFTLGQKVAFRDGSLWQTWRGGLVFDIADDHRIGVLVPKLFGRSAKVYVAASEIEPDDAADSRPYHRRRIP